MKLTRRIITPSRSTKRCCGVLALVVILVTQTACPKVSQSQLDKAAKASKTIATRYVEAVTFVDTLWEGKVIASLQMKDKIADGLITFGKGGKRFNDLIARFSTQYEDGKVPASVWKTIIGNFDQLSAEFLTVLNLLPNAAGLASHPAFRAISAAVLAIAQVLVEVGVSTPRLEQLQKGIARYGLA